MASRRSLCTMDEPSKQFVNSGVNWSRNVAVGVRIAGNSFGMPDGKLAVALFKNLELNLQCPPIANDFRMTVYIFTVFQVLSFRWEKKICFNDEKKKRRLTLKENPDTF